MRADDRFDLGKDRDDLGPGDDGGAVGIGIEVDGVVASLIARLASVVVERPVQKPGVFEELQAEIDCGHDSFVGELGCGDEVLGLGGLSIESLLAQREVGLVDEAFHPGVEELLPLGFKATEALVLGLDGEIVASLTLVEFSGDGSPGGRGLLSGEGHFIPLGFDGSFDLVGGKVREVAAGALPVAPKAEEVGVGPAASGVVSEAEAFTASIAADRSLEVLLQPPRAVPCDLASVQCVLHPVEGGFVDQWVVIARVGDAPVGDVADVVAVAEHPVELAAGERLPGVAASRPGSEASLVEFLSELGQGPFTGCVGAEGPPQVVYALVVDGHGLDGLAVDGGRDVEVPDRCRSGGAAATRLLVEPLLGFGGEVEAVELGHRGHDPVEQLPLGRLVDVLRTGHERGSGLLDRRHDQHVVEAVPGEPVDLVDDHEVDVSL